MKKTFKAILAMMAFSLLLVACGPNEETDGGETAGDSNTLVVYTARSESLNNLVIKEFEKDTGIKVEVVVAGTGELQKRVESEKNNPLGDVLWAGGPAMLTAYQDLFEEYVSPENDNMLDGFKNKTGYFTPAFVDPTVMIVNTDLAEGIRLEGYKDLLNPELKGKISWGDPANSSSSFQVLVSMLYDFGDGDPMSDQAWDYIDELLQNIDGKIASGSGQVHKGVADGEYPVGLTWEDPAAEYVKNGAPVRVVFPEEGATFPGQSVQIIKGAKNLENAKKFIDYMLSEKIQDKVGEELTVRPLRKDAKLADYMTPQADIILSKGHDEEWVAENKELITQKYIEHLEKSMN